MDAAVSFNDSFDKTVAGQAWSQLSLNRHPAFAAFATEFSRAIFFIVNFLQYCLQMSALEKLAGVKKTMGTLWVAQRMLSVMLSSFTRTLAQLPRHSLHLLLSLVRTLLYSL
jgi:hypothetical protein